MRLILLLLSLTSFVEGVTVFRDRVLLERWFFSTDIGATSLTISHSSDEDLGEDSTLFQMANPFSEAALVGSPDDSLPVSSRTSFSAMEDPYPIELGIDWVAAKQGSLLTRENFFEHPIVLRAGSPSTIGLINLLGRESLTLGFLTGGGDLSSGNPAGIGWVRLSIEPSMGLSALSGPLQLKYVDSAWVPANYGIFAGTTTVIPEPSGLLLAGVGLSSLASWRNRKGSKF